MIFIESIKLAFKTIWAHKARAILTMLGIIIGVSSVVLIISLGEGVKKDVKGIVDDLGSNFIFVVAGNLGVMSGQNNQQNQGSFSLGGNGSQVNPANFVSGDILTSDDVKEIKKLSGAQYVAPMSLVSGFLNYEDETVSPTMIATEPDMRYIISGMKLAQGKFISQEDVDNKNKVIMIGDAIKKEFFGDNNDVIGKKITLQNKQNEDEFEIVGTFSQPSTSSMLSSDFSSMCVIPYTVAKDSYSEGKDKIFRIGVKAADNFEIKKLKQEITDNMLTRHKQDEFSVMTQDDILNTLGTILNLLTTFISAIAAISLVVGGVGIMNIMLVSVTERTREIGLRKAVGATNGAILFQFLMEAIILSILGGIMSLLIVRGGIEIIKIYTTITPVITVNSIFLAMGVCIGIGLVFGLAPAVQASRKNPIEALRYE